MDHFIVAIGGSWGSLTPIIEFFDNTPLDNTSYVIVRHIPKDGQNLLQDILSRHSKLKVNLVEDIQALKPNNVYIGSASKNLVIDKQILRPIEREKDGINRSINLFLESLASSAFRKNAIAIILSGAGYDGTAGAKAIKENGGFIIAQEPASSEQSSMPISSIESGNVDIVALASDMPRIIKDYTTKRRDNGWGSREEA